MTQGVRPVAVVTGASSGIGFAAAKALAAQGWKVIGIGRDKARSQTAANALAEVSPEADAVMLRADFSLMADVQRIADEVLLLTDRIDVLINNAGGMTDCLEMTSEGLEANFAGNQLGPFLLTHRLLPLLRAAATNAPAGTVRVLVTSSYSSESAHGFNLDDTQNLAQFHPGLAYSWAKLANVLFMRGLAARLAGSGIVAHAMVPGTTASNFFSHAPQSTLDHVRDTPKHSAEVGADTLVWLATSEEAGRSSGGYWEKRQLRPHNPLADDKAVVDRCWDETIRLIERAGIAAEQFAFN